MDRFHMQFSGESSDKKTWNCSFGYSGDTVAMGRLFAEYAIESAKKHDFELMQILLSAIEVLQRQAPETVSANKIIL